MRLPTRRFGRAHRRAAALVGFTVGIVVSGALVWGSTSAAFVGATTNPGSSWQAGKVSLTDDDGGASPGTGTALFSVTNIQPGDSGQQCITVTYDGGVAALVKVYLTGVSGTLGSYLNLTVDQGSGGSYGDCSGFAGTGIYSGPFSGFGTTYGGGSGTWAPTTTGSTETYRITWSVQDDNNAAGRSLQATFTWEAQNT